MNGKREFLNLNKNLMELDFNEKIATPQNEYNLITLNTIYGLNDDGLQTTYIDYSGGNMHKNALPLRGSECEIGATGQDYNIL